MRYSNQSKRKATGQVYTPLEMANYVVELMLKYKPPGAQKEVAILDPAVGEGELLIALISALKSTGKIIKAVGYETDSDAAAFTQKRIETSFPDIEIDLRVGDFLSAIEQNTVGKYDYVIANPPYIRTQIMGSKKAQEIADKLALCGRIDIYYAFLVCTKDVLKEDGIAGYITSNKFMTIKAGNSVRNYMLQNYQIHHITDLGDTKLFNAAVLPCIIAFTLGKTTEKAKVGFTSVYETEKNGSQIINSIFDKINECGYYSLTNGRSYHYQQGIIKSVNNNDLWTIESDENKKWLDRVETNTWMLFSQIGKIRVGIKTTADNVFIGDDWSGDYADLELLRPIITHRNAGQIIPNSTPHWKVLYTHTTECGKKVAYDIEKYPKTKAYLEKHYEQLASRKYVIDAHRNWYEIWVPQNPESWKHKKIVFRDISERPEFWYDETGAIVNGDCYWIDILPNTIDDIVFLALAVANSRFIEKYYDTKFNTKLYSGKRRFQTQYVAQFPIPFYGTETAQKAISYVKKIIAEGDSNLTSSYKSELDDIVDELFA